RSRTSVERMRSSACPMQASKVIATRAWPAILERERIPATIFVTDRWLKRNTAALAVFLQNPDILELENHGQNHIPAVDTPTLIYGIAS
ncbi:hypothetical protein ACEQ6A_34945, partial [Rhizobium brockwellii]